MVEIVGTLLLKDNKCKGCELRCVGWVDRTGSRPKLQTFKVIFTHDQNIHYL